MNTTMMERKARNQAINKAFTARYAETKESLGRATYQGIYFALAREFGLSEMQIRRIVKGY
jgi:hypothetical protein